jgi:hypothetical protein
MDYLRIAGNEEILNDWIDYLLRCNLILVEEQKDGKVAYKKTELGERLHSVLKNHDYLGPLLSDLGRERRKPKYE